MKSKANKALYRIRHKPTGKWLFRQRSSHGFACRLLPDERHPDWKPSEWTYRSDAFRAMVTTPFGIKNLELVTL